MNCGMNPAGSWAITASHRLPGLPIRYARRVDPMSSGPIGRQHRTSPGGRTLDDNYHDHELALLYDQLNPWSESDEFYFGIAAQRNGPTADLACGTGALACRIASTGLPTVGVDSAPAMIDVARGRPGGDDVRWIVGDVRTFTSKTMFDTAIMSGHAFQALTADDDIARFLGCARAALRAGGMLAFETRNPSSRPWDSWTPEKRQRRITDADGAPITVIFDARFDEGSGLVDLATHYHFEATGATRVAHSQLRFVERELLADLLSNAGFTEVRWMGDWLGRPLGSDSQEIIVQAQV